MYFGAKFRSAMYLCVGVSALFPVVLLGLGFPPLGWPFGIKFSGLIFVVSFCLLVVRRSKIDPNVRQWPEVWGSRIAGFTICAPFLAYCLYLLATIFPRYYIKFIPVSQLLVLMIPCVIGGIFYLFLGAKRRSFKYASVGLATILIVFLNSIYLLTLSFSFFD